MRVKKYLVLYNAKELVKKFNTKFDTNYQWNELYSIEIAFYNEDGDRID